jgi:hypothetical protein
MLVRDLLANEANDCRDYRRSALPKRRFAFEPFRNTELKGVAMQDYLEEVLEAQYLEYDDDEAPEAVDEWLEV